MASYAATSRATSAVASSTSYERFAAVCAIAAGLVGFVYSVGFIVLKNPLLYSTCLLILGLLTVASLTAVYQRLREVDGSFALLGLLLGVIGALGASIHGGYDLSNTLHPPAQISPDLPSAIDPRGLLTFGLAGLGLWVVAWLMLRAPSFPKALGYLGYVAAVLAIILYLARLIVLDATSLAIVVPALLAGFIVNPIWYIWLGLSLWRSPR